MLQISDFLDQWINAKILTFILAVVSIKAVGCWPPSLNNGKKWWIRWLKIHAHTPYTHRFPKSMTNNRIVHHSSNLTMADIRTKTIRTEMICVQPLFSRTKILFFYFLFIRNRNGNSNGSLFSNKCNVRILIDPISDTNGYHFDKPLMLITGNF